MSGAVWDATFDTIIVGSGAGAMTCALNAKHRGLQPVLLEKSALYGGSSAMSGGAVWVPNNPWMKAAGIEDSAAEALTYLRQITRGEVAEARLEAYVTHANRMATFLVENTAARFVSLHQYPDYYPEVEGGKPGGRSLESVPYRALKLGALWDQLRPSHPQEVMLGRMGLTAAEAHSLVQGSRWTVFKRMASYYADLPARRLGRRDGRLVLGNALIGRLRRSLADREIPLHLDHGVSKLVVEDGVVVGVIVERPDGPQRYRARRGVVLAAGGFARNQTLRERYLPGPTSEAWSSANPENQGGAIEMGLEVGAAIATMDGAWWTPVTLIPGKAFSWILVVEKSMPGSIMVDGRGCRFTNEAAPYIDVVEGIYGSAQGKAPCWLVFDARYRKQYPCGPLPPGQYMPDARLSRRLREGFLKRAATLEALAEDIGVDSAGLVATVARFNAQARAGRDEEFGRGESLYDRYYSDPKVAPNPNLAPLEQAPYYAIPVYPGDLGTKGGLVTDARARVLNTDGEPIAGLYAIGNSSASVMGPTYPGAGGTIGPAMTFGFVAAEEMALENTPSGG